MTRTRAAAALAVLLGLVVLVVPSSAATRTVHLTNTGPDPAELTISAGDRVVFVNDDGVPHQVRSEGGWQFDSGPLPPGRTSEQTPALTAPGTYRYTDTRGIVILPRTFEGQLVVPAPKPTPRPSTPPSVRPSARPSASPAPTQTAAPTPSPSATASPTPSPVASATPSPTPPTPPTPPVATSEPLPPVASPPPSQPPPSYGGAQALVQGSPHRYGLPVLVALVLALGVLSLLGRYLLSLPDDRPARDGRW